MLELFAIQYPLLGCLLLSFIFLCVGSLLNVVIHRLPLMLEQEWQEQCQHLSNQEISSTAKRVNLFFPRSFCPSCKKTITAWQNIPILSYLFLKGRCYHCKTAIPLRYPLVEAMTLALSLFCLLHFGYTLSAVFAILFIWLVIPLFFIDLDRQLLPDSLTLGLLWLGLIANTAAIFSPLNEAVLAAALAWLSLWLFIQLFYLITGKIGMGHGDFKLFAAFGAWFGWQALPFILIFASFTGAVLGFIALQMKNQGTDTPIPFGPFLITAAVIYLFFGKVILHWYAGLAF